MAAPSLQQPLRGECVGLPASRLAAACRGPRHRYACRGLRLVCRSEPCSPSCVLLHSTQLRRGLRWTAIQSRTLICCSSTGTVTHPPDLRSCLGAARCRCRRPSLLPALSCNRADTQPCQVHCWHATSTTQHSCCCCRQLQLCFFAEEGSLQRAQRLCQACCCCGEAVPHRGPGACCCRAPVAGNA